VQQARNLAMDLGDRLGARVARPDPIIGECHLDLVLREYLAITTGTGRTGLGSSGPRTSRQNPTGMWPTCDLSAEDPWLRG
jgi:hypothetical protein